MTKLKSIFALLLILILFSFLSCKSTDTKAPVLHPIEIQTVIRNMTDIMIHDITNPPLAARFFSYTCLAGYEVVSQNDTAFLSMHRILNDYPTIEKPAVSDYSYQLAAILAMLETAKKMQPSGSILAVYEEKYLDSCQNVGFSKEMIDNSLKYAQDISQQILKYAKADKYNRISNFARYTPSNTEGSWYPTPPGYMAPVEPYFNTVRPFTLDSATQFKPVPPIAFSKEKNSDFYKLMEAVYKEKLSQAHQDIAAFWDCNPFALQDNGHLMVGMKKISPGAHWMGIAGIACKKRKQVLLKRFKSIRF